MPPLSFEIAHRSATSLARLGRVTTRNGSFDTPAFMPVGTQGTIKGLLPSMVAATGAQIILANTFHLMLRPGSHLVAQMGGSEGLHPWIGWPGPMLTDSGGFQVFSLADINKISDEGVVFRSPHDGSRVDLTPERSMQVQNELAADIIMAFDDCPPARGGGQETGDRRQGTGDRGQETGERGQETEESNDATSAVSGNAAGVWTDDPAHPACSETLHPKPYTLDPSYSLRVKQACERSIRWLDRCVKAHGRPHDQALFPIVQGGTDLDQRSWCAQAILQHDLPGYAIGGVAVGEGFEELKRVVEFTAPLLPTGKPRYLMGVGYERDILTAVRAGVDMFDCVLPTRNGRNANAFTPTGQIRLRNAKYATDPRPIDETCDCLACGGPRGTEGRRDEGTKGGNSDPRASCLEILDPSVPQSLRPFSSGFSRSYLRHLFMAGEMLGPILVSIHNLRHFQRYMLDIRATIRDDDWSGLLQRWPVAATGPILQPAAT